MRHYSTHVIISQMEVVGYSDFVCGSCGEESEETRSLVCERCRKLICAYCWNHSGFLDLKFWGIGGYICAKCINLHMGDTECTTAIVNYAATIKNGRV